MPKPIVTHFVRRTPEEKAQQRQCARSKRRRMTDQERVALGLDGTPALAFFRMLPDDRKRVSVTADDAREIAQRCGVRVVPVSTDPDDVAYAVKVPQPPVAIFDARERPGGRHRMDDMLIRENERYLRQLAADPDVEIHNREDRDRWFLQQYARGKYTGIAAPAVLASAARG